ncbi:MAG: cytoplasmic protein [Deltaproteobacteria bacterium]|nr:cytoplasmic protein [Deltaproteobacteria bacterium]MDL1961963.1 cytoplasmic protein [Deltaproteobacteria bacterium]
MSENNLNIKNPLSFIKEDAGQLLKEGQFGAILARAGEGKTSFLMHLALDNLLSGKNVLHICLGQPIKKVCLWYEEVLHRISDQYELNNTNVMWEMILPHRFIMTFNIEDFSVKRLEERLNDLTEQGVFFPQIVLLDGLPFNKIVQESLSKLKAMSKEHGFPAWFTVMTHREDNVEQPDDIPSPISHMSDLFEVIVQLKPVGREISVQLIKGQKAESPASNT